MNGRQFTVSAALVVLICFFLPWIQVSCGGTTDAASGVDLARDGNRALWLIPLLMLVVLSFALKLWKERDQLFSLVSLLSGLVTGYLMNRERLKFQDSSSLISVGVTGWFWLGLGSSVAIVIIAVARILKIGKVINDA